MQRTRDPVNGFVEKIYEAVTLSVLSDIRREMNTISWLALHEQHDDSFLGMRLKTSGHHNVISKNSDVRGLSTGLFRGTPALSMTD